MLINMLGIRRMPDYLSLLPRRMRRRQSLHSFCREGCATNGKRERGMPRIFARCQAESLMLRHCGHASQTRPIYVSKFTGPLEVTFYWTDRILALWPYLCCYLAIFQAIRGLLDSDLKWRAATCLSMRERLRHRQASKFAVITFPPPQQEQQPQGLPLMMSTRISGFFTLSPIVRIWDWFML